MISLRSSGSKREASGVEPTRSGFLVLQDGYGLEQPAAVAERRHPDVFEVLVRQRRQDRRVNVVVAENRLVSLEAQIFEPAEDIHGAPRVLLVGFFWLCELGKRRRRLFPLTNLGSACGAITLALARGGDDRISTATMPRTLDSIVARLKCICATHGNAVLVA